MKLLNKLTISGNTLKIIAMISMLIDHAGLLLFNDNEVMRIIGRLAFPLFAFLLAEGCYYTKNKLRHFLEIFILGALCQVVYFIQSNEWYFGVLITFSFSIPIVYSIIYSKKRPAFCPITIILIILSYFLCEILPTLIPRAGLYFDYGFFGLLLPVFICLFNNKWLKLFSTAVGIIILCLALDRNTQWFSLFSLIPILLYNGQKGKLKLKYTFYIFYPLHLAILYLIAFLVK